MEGKCGWCGGGCRPGKVGGPENLGFPSFRDVSGREVPVRSCSVSGSQSGSGSNPVLPSEFSIPMPIPMPIATRAARVGRPGSPSIGDVSGR